MRQKLRPHLTFANVASALALFIAVSTGGAYATHLVVNSSDVVNESLLSQDVKGTNGTATTAAVNGTLTGADISGQAAKPSLGQPFVDGSLTSADVKNNSLTGADIANNSGVNTCPSPATARFGRICAGSDGGMRNWNGASDYCAGLGLRLPTVAEALALARNYDVPGGDQYFWTQDLWFDAVLRAAAVSESGLSSEILAEDTHPSNDSDRTVCVTDPSN